MHSNPKLGALQRQQSHAERLFGKDAALTAAVPVAVVPVAVETRAGADDSLVKETTDGDVVRRSYIILRGRIEALPSLELKNRQGQTRLIPWHYFGGASLDHPGELVLTFDGPEGSCQVTLHGRGLDAELMGGVKAQKVSLICELDELAAAAAARAGEPLVSGIWIKGGGREWRRTAEHSR
jgi:hypothetical protein